MNPQTETGALANLREELSTDDFDITDEHINRCVALVLEVIETAEKNGAFPENAPDLEIVSDILIKIRKLNPSLVEKWEDSLMFADQACFLVPIEPIEERTRDRWIEEWVGQQDRNRARAISALTQIPRGKLMYRIRS